MFGNTDARLDKDAYTVTLGALLVGFLMLGESHTPLLYFLLRLSSNSPTMDGRTDGREYSSKSYASSMASCSGVLDRVSQYN